MIDRARPARAGGTRWLGRPLAALFVVCVPLAFIGTNVRWVTLDPNTYRAGFVKYHAAARTGLDDEQLARIARAFIDYFQGRPGRLEPQVTIRGVQRPLFNEREIAHMEDVQALMQLVFRVGALAGGYALVYALAMLASERGAGRRPLGRLLLWGSGLSGALLLSVAGLSLLDFSELFVRFHQLSFRNDLWMLDPSRDYLIILFPEGFWLDITLRIAALTAGESLAAGVIGLLLARRA